MSENMDKHICMECGCTDEDLFEVCINGEDKVLCADCLHDLGYCQCEDCGEWFPDDEMHETHDGDSVCESCADENYFICEDCGELFPVDVMVTVNPGTHRESVVCEDCADSNYYRCDDCDRYFDSVYTHDDGYGNHICDDCYDAHWCTCEDCGRLIRSEDAHWDDDEDECYCDECWERHGAGEFHNYGYKPTPDFKYRSGETKHDDYREKLLTFGVELEVDKGEDHMKLTNELSKLGQPIYMKHDGSLDREGVEIVTHPCTLAYHQYDLRWAEISRQCCKLGYKSHDAGTCGLHIHIGRQQMGEDYVAQKRTAGNLVLLAYKLREQLTTFSRRTPEQLEQWAGMPDLEGRGYLAGCSYTDEELAGMALRTRNYGRYQAVNLCNEETVELRFFRGTLKRDTIIASLQLASNLTKYAMTHTPTECINANWADVVSVEQFKELNAYCQSRGL